VAAAFLFFQPGLQLGGEIAAIPLLRQEQFDGQRGTFLVGDWWALFRQLFGDLQQLRVQFGANRLDLLGQNRPRILGRAGILPPGRRFGRRLGAEEPGQKTGFSGGFPVFIRFRLGQGRASFARDGWIDSVLTTLGNNILVKGYTPSYM
jgi:hypothetical protein